MPEQELKGFQKTMLLAPGEKEDIKIRIPLRNLASYSENAGGYIPVSYTHLTLPTIA